MKKNLCIVFVSFTLLVGFQSKSIAQANDSASLGVTRHTENNRDGNNGRSNWGLLGLVGLIGLAGLTKKNVIDKKVKFRDRPIR